MTSCTRAGRPFGDPMTEALPIVPAPVTVPGTLSILAIQGARIFPEMVSPMLIEQTAAIRLVEDSLRGHRLVGLVTQPPNAPLCVEELPRVGTAAIIQEMLPAADGTFRLVVQGICRFKISEALTIDPYLLARVEEAPEIEATGREVELWARHARSEYQQLLSLTANLPSELAFDLAGITGARELAYMAASTSTLSVSDKQELLELDSVSLKLRRLVELLRAARREREHCLRAQLKTIHEQLGEPDPVRNEASELEARLIQAELPEEHAAEIHSELRRFATLPLASPERGSIATYLDWMASLPWRRHQSQPIDIERARQLLDRYYYALDDIKSRVLEHLAVQRLRALREGRERDPGRSPILCLVGPPGIGKTSLGESIARAVGRAFVRISLGGIHDEAEIRGHRRTYVGAMPGRIIQAVRRAQVSNPVCLLDEIDKLGNSHEGDPAAALLEVLDPAENRTLRRQLPSRPVRSFADHVHLHGQQRRWAPRRVARSARGLDAAGLHRSRQASHRAPALATCAAR